MSGAFRIAIVLAAAAAATIVANFVLLGVATGRQDPVGRLSPRAVTAVTAVTPAGKQSVAHAVAPVRHGRESERSDD